MNCTLGISNGVKVLHFFLLQQGYSAFKDVENGICFIEETNHTMQELQDALQSLTSVSFHF